MCLVSKMNPSSSSPKFVWCSSFTRRTSEWSTLCCEDAFTEIASDLNQAEEQLEADKRIDMLFINEPARIAFLQLRSYVVPEKIEDCKSDASILTLARADAYMTTMLK